MSLRTVWEKWSRQSKTGYELVYGERANWGTTETYGTPYLYSTCTVNQNTGELTLSGRFRASNGNSGYYESGSVINHGTVQYDGLYYNYVYFCTVSSKSYTYYEKGTTSYGYIASSSESAYPDNSYSGSYWYVKSGQDTLDPSAVSYDTPQGGQLLDISITPSAGKVYGGTTYYKYEYSLDGGTSWNVANESTTAETISVLVPYGSASFTARVTASDNLGFTSTDAVTGETLTVINNAAPVITCGVTDLGTVEAGFTVDYSVSDSDGDTVTVDITLDGAKIQSVVTPTGGGYWQHNHRQRPVPAAA